MWVRNKALAHIALLAVAVAAVTRKSALSYQKFKTVKRLA